MSLLIFPAFAPGQFNWTFPIKQTPLFNTIIQTPASGRGELRIPTMQFPRFDFVVDLSYLKGDAQGVNTAWQKIYNFFMAVQGAASDWLFLHPWDNSVTLQAIAVGDGATVAFTMFRTFISSGAQDLQQNFVSPPSIYVNGILKTVVTDYTIDQYGTLTFVVPPPATQVVAWTGQFYYRCHFLDDSWSDLEERWYQVWSQHSLKFRSVLL